MNEELLRYIFSNVVNQSIYNRENCWKQLPNDQQEALNKLLEAIHDFAKSYSENIVKIEAQYKAQAMDAMVLKAESELGWNIGGQNG